MPLDFSAGRNGRFSTNFCVIHSFELFFLSYHYGSAVGDAYASPATHMRRLGDAYASPSHLKKSLNICLQRNQSSKSLDKTRFCLLGGLNTY